MTDCIFCKIANHEIPSSIVYEDDVVIAFLDLSQVTKGHTLWYPRGMSLIFLNMMKNWRRKSFRASLKSHAQSNVPAMTF